MMAVGGGRHRSVLYSEKAGAAGGGKATYWVRRDVDVLRCRGRASIRVLYVFFFLWSLLKPQGRPFCCLAVRRLGGLRTDSGGASRTSGDPLFRCGWR